MTDTRDLLEYIIACNPGVELYIGPRAPIIHSTDFEAGVIKIQGKADHDLSDVGKNAIKRFLKPSVHRNHNETTTSSGEDVVENLEALRKRRRIENHTSFYADVKHVPPTSNICERLCCSIASCIGYFQLFCALLYTLLHMPALLCHSV